MHVLVTGATGFLGRNLAQALARRGDAVSVLVRSTSQISFLGQLPVTVHTGDLQDRASLLRATRGKDVVFHCAGKVADWGTPHEFYRVNVDGTKNLLDASRRAGIRHFIHASSLVVLGIPRNNPVNETTPHTTRIFEPYTATKIIAEKMVIEYSEQHRLPATIIRPGIIWGPGDTTVFPRIVRLARRGFIFNIGTGNNVLCLSYIDNLVHAFILAAECAQEAVDVYHIADEDKITSKMFFSSLTEALGIKPPAVSIPFAVLYAAAYICEAGARLLRLPSAPPLTRLGLYLWGTNYIADISKAKNKLGYRQLVTFKDGLRQLAAWYRMTWQPLAG